jgi:hypothetical protein
MPGKQIVEALAILSFFDSNVWVYVQPTETMCGHVQDIGEPIIIPAA